MVSANFSSGLLAGVLREGLMDPRPDWNRAGPPVPAWFRWQLKRIDPQLYLQFMPPDTQDSDGVNARMFPRGVWAICRLMKRSGMLLKRWTWHLADSKGNYSPPDGATVAILQYAYDCYRAGVNDGFEEKLDSHMTALKSAGRSKDRNRLSNGIYDMIVKHNMFSNIAGKTRVLFRKAPWK